MSCRTQARTGGDGVERGAFKPAAEFVLQVEGPCVTEPGKRTWRNLAAGTLGDVNAHWERLMTRLKYDAEKRRQLLEGFGFAKARVVRVEKGIAEVVFGWTCEDLKGVEYVGGVGQ